MKIFAVYDTNILVSGLLSKHQDSAVVLTLEALLNKEVTPLYNQEILDEYRDVLPEVGRIGNYCYLLLLHQEVFLTLDRMVAGGHPPPSCRRGKDLDQSFSVFLRTKEVLGDERIAILVSLSIPQLSLCRPLPFPILWSLGKV